MENKEEIEPPAPPAERDLNGIVDALSMGMGEMQTQIEDLKSWQNKSQERMEVLQTTAMTAISELNAKMTAMEQSIIQLQPQSPPPPPMEEAENVNLPNGEIVPPEPPPKTVPEMRRLQNLPPAERHRI